MSEYLFLGILVIFNNAFGVFSLCSTAAAAERRVRGMRQPSHVIRAVVKGHAYVIAH